MIFRKKLDRLVAIEFIGPYLLSFLLAEFVMVMQFLWKYIDDLTGKGLSFLEISNLVFLFGVTIIPMAIPITILLASVFVFGNMSEKFELTSCKSAGISLMRVMQVGIFYAVLTAIFSLVCSNYLAPKANKAFFNSFYAIRNQKSALSIEPKIFNADFNGFSIYVDDKDPDNNTVHDILIYDHTSTSSYDVTMVSADKGVMDISDDGAYFIMNLENGVQMRELPNKLDPKTKKKQKKFPLIRTSFEKWKKVFDLDEFKMDDSNINLNRKKYDLMNTFQLLTAIDSNKQAIFDNREKALYNFNKALTFDDYIAKSKKKKKEDTKLSDNLSKIKKAPQKVLEKSKLLNKSKQKTVNIKQQKLDELSSIDGFLETIPEEHRATIMTNVQRNLHTRTNQLGSLYQKEKNISYQQSEATMKLHTQYSWAFICIIFLFIGAPLGSIIRKGGYGYPLLMAILFFMFFRILIIVGDRLHRGFTIGPVAAAWLPCLVLIPFAIYFTVRAINDSSFVNFSLFKFRKDN